MTKKNDERKNDGKKEDKRGWKKIGERIWRKKRQKKNIPCVIDLL